MLGIVVRVVIVAWVAVAVYGIWSIEMRDPELALALAFGLCIAILIGIGIDMAVSARRDYES